MNNFKRKRTFHRVLSLLLVAVLIFGATTQVFAVETVNRPVNAKKELLINGFEKSGFNIVNMNECAKKVELDMEFEETDGSIINSNVTITEKANGDIEMLCVENGKCDIVELKANGQVIANGNLVQVTEEIESRAASIGEEIVPYGRHYNVWTNTCPYGSSADYSREYGVNKRTLNFEQAIADFTVSALCGIIVGIIMGSGVAGTLIAAAGGSIINYFRNNNPQARAMSCIDTTYVHSTKGVIIDGVHIYKHVFKYYATTNYTILTATSISYNKILT